MLYDDLIERIFGQDISYSFELGMIEIVEQEIDECDFEDIDSHIGMYFTKCTFLETVSFANLKRIEVRQCIFEQDVNFSSIPEIQFDECVFNGTVNVHKSSCLYWYFGKNTFRHGFWFERTVGERISFCQNTFDEFLYWNQNQFDVITMNQNKMHDLHIRESIFNILEMDFNKIERADFLLSTFEKSTEIINSNFQIINFQDSKFLSFLILDGSKFEKFFNFTNIQCIEIPNISKAFLVGKIQTSEQAFFYSFRELAGKREFRIDLRKCFQTLKDNYIKQNNLLDSLDYHRMELYCKEIELDSKNPPILSREWIDKWQLFFYRQTSDHHTDLLQIISWIVVAIGGFGLALFACKYGTNLQAFIDSHSKGTLIGFFNVPFFTQSKIIDLVYLVGFCSLFWRWSRLLFFSGVTFWIAYCKPSLIFGVMNLIDRSPRSGVENLLLVFYTLVMILLLFSLQKTARKNSIVPS
ncbi:hypothetical protein [Helicobacter kayseriensis]|uniref:hypothetical protein n=1 Tax=Helicobacter kayseriensis TaxID=2905877 RepID=UPI001E3AC09B|nr:hypothetical protein [Helicobacter kayseriensis]MCE3047388.1 hypothetical protein [Helicobacter kayseriensis]MCE3048941.1 hypothetical protein [Helicobacter kayseriensis]